MSSILTESVLSCTSWHQAQNIVDHLFSKQLISRAEILPGSTADGVKLIIENIEHDSAGIYAELSEFFGLDTYKLISIQP